jgi:hypothetical protein
MVKKKRREEHPHQENEDIRAGDESRERRLFELGKKYATFRQENRPRTRIPDYLRDSALEEIQRGTPESEVIKACKVSHELLDRWREVKCGHPRRVKAKKPKARVFPVIDEKASGIESPVIGAEESSTLQLRIGGWAITIRQNA